VQQDSEALGLRQVVGVVRRRLVLVLLCVVVVGGAAFGFSRGEAKKFTATASLVFGSNPLGQQIAGLSAGSSSASSVLAQQASDLELVRLGDMAARTARLLGRGLTEERVAGSLSIGGQGESSVVDVSATAGSGVLAAAIANTYVRQFVREQQGVSRRYFESALALVDRQLGALSPRERVGPDGVELQNRAQTLNLLLGLDRGGVQVAQEALVPASPSSPKTSKNTALGVLLGLVIGLGLAFVLERFDRRIRGPEDLEGVYRLPLLGVVPKSAALARSAREGRRKRREGGGKRVVLAPVAADAFGLIRAHLRFFNIDRDLRAVAIASPAAGDGKSTIARHLAEVAARSGSRVLLLEVDLRHPTLARQLGIGPGPGLAEVLIGAIPVGEATRSVVLQSASGGDSTQRTLDVLAAGAVLPPNPAELLESYAMDGVLDRAKSEYDLVVIDTPPLTAVPDAFPLLTKVDGVVIVGWVGRSRRDTAEQLHQVLASSRAPLLGVIANGSKTGSPSLYTTPTYTTPTNTTPTSTTPTSTAPPTTSTNGASPHEQLIPTTEA
jgi:polysaccharide biosynthesis transport protein